MCPQGVEQTVVRRKEGGKGGHTCQGDICWRMSYLPYRKPLEGTHKQTQVSKMQGTHKQTQVSRI